MTSSLSVILFVLTTIQITKTDGQKLYFGGEARRVCEAYKLICPAKKVCALQSIEWPRAMKFPVCVHEKHLKVKSNICKRPPQPGKCKAKFTRWYFNVHMAACSWFTYGGCGGNSNNFRTAEQCEKSCMTPENDVTNTSKPESHNGINTILLEDEPKNQTKSDVTREGSRKVIKVLSAPAREPEVINRDNVRASLQLDQRKKDLSITKALREERRRQRRLRKEKKRRRMRKNKMKLNRKNLTIYRKPRLIKPVTKSPVRPLQLKRVTKVKPTRQLSALELGPSYHSRNQNKGHAHLTGRETEYSIRGRPQEDQWSQEWLMDRHFRPTKGRKRRRRRRRYHNRRRPTPNNRKFTPAPRYGKPMNDQRSQSTPGANQATYYDKVELFNILEKVSVPKKEVTRELI